MEWPWAPSASLSSGTSAVGTCKRSNIDERMDVLAMSRPGEAPCPTSLHSTFLPHRHTTPQQRARGMGTVLLQECCSGHLREVEHG